MRYSRDPHRRASSAIVLCRCAITTSRVISDSTRARPSRVASRSRSTRSASRRSSVHVAGVSPRKRSSSGAGSSGFSASSAASRCRPVRRVATRRRRRSRSRIGSLPPDAVLQRPQARLQLAGLLDPGRHGHQVGQRPRTRDRVLQLDDVQQRHFQDPPQPRARLDLLEIEGPPDRALAPAAQPPQPTRLGGGLAGLVRVPEAGAARAQGPARGRGARSASARGSRAG